MAGQAEDHREYVYKEELLADISSLLTMFKNVDREFLVEKIQGYTIENLWKIILRFEKKFDSLGEQITDLATSEIVACFGITEEQPVNKSRQNYVFSIVSNEFRQLVFKTKKYLKKQGTEKADIASDLLSHFIDRKLTGAEDEEKVRETMKRIEKELENNHMIHDLERKEKKIIEMIQQFYETTPCNKQFIAGKYVYLTYERVKHIVEEHENVQKRSGRTSTYKTEFNAGFLPRHTLHLAQLAFDKVATDSFLSEIIEKKILEVEKCFKKYKKEKRKFPKEANRVEFYVLVKSRTLSLPKLKIVLERRDEKSYEIITMFPQMP